MRSSARILAGLGLVVAGVVMPAGTALATTTGQVGATASTSAVGSPAQPPTFMCAPNTDGWVVKSTGDDYWECKPDIGNPQVFEWQRLG